ncbi:hypothetical protein [Aliiroseovarius sp. F20344]|uniref:hypothetical protein n=1 Tax=Aliiroseovarius sp. F20344 TaxID=2926414 RepID=UPI001FF319F8|nr:hypothetical protein [Aliiroseovarius sp. F20344]MCK0143003.1 hypothetical protein [Aliiroseovarius sp. F20344]
MVSKKSIRVALLRMAGTPAYALGQVHNCPLDQKGQAAHSGYWEYRRMQRRSFSQADVGQSFVFDASILRCLSAVERSEQNISLDNLFGVATGLGVESWQFLK